MQIFTTNDVHGDNTLISEGKRLYNAELGIVWHGKLGVFLQKGDGFRRKSIDFPPQSADTTI